MSIVETCRRAVLLGVIVLMPVAGPVQADTALNFTDTQIHGFLFPLTFGWEFTVNEPITVDSLGIRDTLAPGLAVSHDVGIFSVSDMALLVSATLSNADALNGFFRYRAVTPTTLQPGVVYLCAGFDPEYPTGSPVDSIGRPEIGNLTSTVAPEITYRGWVAESTNGLQFPLPYNPTMDPWAASDGHLNNANFTFTPACSLEAIVQGETRSLPFGLDPSDLLETFRSFRDDLLMVDAEGPELARLYYQVSPELKTLLRNQPSLTADVLSILSSALPAIREALRTDGVVVLDPQTAEKAFALAREISAEASPELRVAIEQARRFASERLKRTAGAVELRFATESRPVAF